MTWDGSGDRLVGLRWIWEVSCGAPSCPSFPVHTLVGQVRLLDPLVNP